jgi:hypothetical protein
MASSVRVGKNQLASVQQLWMAVEWAVPSGPLQAPAGPLRIYWRVPPLRLSCTRLCWLPLAVSVAVPVSSSEPAT